MGPKNKAKQPQRDVRRSTEPAPKTKRKAVEDISPATSKIVKSNKHKPRSLNKPKNGLGSNESATPKAPVNTATGKDNANENEGEQEEEGVLRFADEFDSSDEEHDTPVSSFRPGQNVGRIPDVSDAVAKIAKNQPSGETGVVYVGRVPHGFYEYEMRSYLSQFGPIVNLRLSRNKRTGASKHYAFVEFAEAETAEIVAKTMNNYLLFGHLLKVKVVPKEQLHENIWKGANRRYKKVPGSRLEAKEQEKPKTVEVWNKRIAKEKKKRAETAAKLKAIGYEFEAPELKEAVAYEPPVDEASERQEQIESGPGGDEDNDEDKAPKLPVTEAAEVARDAGEGAAMTKGGKSKAVKRNSGKAKA